MMMILHLPVQVQNQNVDFPVIRILMTRSSLMNFCSLKFFLMTLRTKFRSSFFLFLFFSFLFSSNEEINRSKSQTEEQALLRRKKRLKKLRKMYEAQFYRLRDSLRTKHRIFVTKRNEALLESGCPRLDKQKKKKKDAEDEEDIEMETIPLDGEVGPTTNRSEEAHVPRSSNEEKKSTTEDLKSKRIATEDERKREQKLASCAKKRRFLQSHFQQNPSPYAWELHQLCGRSGLSGDYERMYVPCVIGNNSKYFVKQSVAGSRKKKQVFFSLLFFPCLLLSHQFILNRGFSHVVTQIASHHAFHRQNTAKLTSSMQLTRHSFVLVTIQVL